MLKKVLLYIDKCITKLFVMYFQKYKRTVYLIRNYTFEDLMLKKRIILSELHSLSKNEIHNFKYIGESTEIYFSSTQSNSKLFYGDEVAYLNLLVKIFKILETHNRTYNVIIDITNRELLKQCKLLDCCTNINLTIFTDCHNYNIDEYLEEDGKLDNFVKDIKNSSLSPYEKYLAVYNIVKRFKPYQENENNPKESRFLKYILNNDYMVCVEYATLLKTLLDKIGISCIQMGVKVDTSCDEEVIVDNTSTKLVGHERNIIKIDDDKYNIHGIFVVDVTWDNNMDFDLYNNSAMTFDRKKESFRLEKLTDEDLLLDFHNIKDFIDKINFYLRKEMRTIVSDSFYDKLSIAYKDLYIKIMQLLMQLDYQEYLKLHDRYDSIIYYNRYEKNATVQEIDEVFREFLTDYARYIIPISNKKINTRTLYEAALNVKKVIDGYDKKELKQWNKTTKKINEMRAAIKFPYRFEPSESRINYLKCRCKRRIKINN